MTLGVARWRAILAPWRLQLMAARPHSPRFDSLSSAQRFPPMTSAAWREFVLRGREAMELLRALVAVEQVSWDDAFDALLSTRSTWAPPPLSARHVQNASWLGAEPGRDHPVLSSFGHELIRPQANRGRNANVVELATIYFGMDESAMRPQFRLAMQGVYAALSPEERRRLDQQEALSVQFTFTMRHAPTGMTGAAYLHRIGDFVRLVASRSAAERPRGSGSGSDQWRFQFPFKLTKLSVMDVNEFAFDQRGLSAALTELLALGVQLYEGFDLSRSSWFMSCPISELGPILRSLTDESSLRSLGVEKVLPSTSVSKMRLESFGYGKPGVDERARLRQLGAVFSGLAVSRDTKELVLRLSRTDAFSPESGERHLKWLTYALFSKDSASSVTSLEIDDAYELTADDAVGITRILEARNPSRALLDTTMVTVIPKTVAPTYIEIIDDEDEEDRDLGFAVVKAGTTIKIKPLDVPNEHATDAFVLQQDGRFRIMRNADGSNWIDIVVPCYGHCVVARDAVAHVDLSIAPGSSLSAGYSGAITSLKLGHSECRALLPLIEFVGPKLERLTIEAEMTNDDVHRVLLACPNLLDLTLGRTLESADEVFIEAYESGRCKIEHLSIDGFFSDSSPYYDEGSTEFIWELQNLASAAATTLRGLTLLDARISEDFLDACVSMLAVNRTLEFLSFCVQDDYLEDRESALMATNGMRLPARPLLLKQKHAFLSVLRRFDSSSAPPLLSSSSSPSSSASALSLSSPSSASAPAPASLPTSPSSSSVEPPRKRPRQTIANCRVDYGHLDRLVISLIFEFAGARGGIRRLQVDGYDGENTPPER